MRKLIVYILFIAASGYPAATDFFWTNGAGYWSTAINWTNNATDGTAPVAGGSNAYTINFWRSNTGGATNDLAGTFKCNKIAFGNTTRIFGNAIALTNNGSTLPTVLQRGANAANIINDSLIFSADVVFTNTSTGDVYMRCPMSGKGAFIMAGDNEVTIFTNNMGLINSYSGETIINGGKLLFNNSGAHNMVFAGTNTITLNSGQLVFTRVFVVNSNTIILNGGQLSMNNGFGSQWGGKVILNAVVPIQCADYGTVAYLDLYNEISGTGGFNFTELSVDEYSDMRLWATNTYTGPSTIIAGIVEFNCKLALGSGSLAISNGAIAALNYTGTRYISALILGGTNKDTGVYGSMVSDAANKSAHFGSTGTVTVTASPPFIDVTNQPVTVPYTTTNYIVAGTNNANVVGVMYVTNATAGGAAINFNAAASWSASAIGLNFGENNLSVYGTNTQGYSYNDGVIVTREKPFKSVIVYSTNDIRAIVIGNKLFIVR